MPPRTSNTEKPSSILKSSQNGLSAIFIAGLLLVWIAVLGLIAANRQNLIDWAKLRDYQAPIPISSLATQTSMTDYARHVFYVNKPQIRADVSFSKACPDSSHGGEPTIVLGCYHGNQNGIFVLDVNDSRLNGVEQVTAAHEMLHAAYDRLSGSDRKKIDAMLEDYYQYDLHDDRIKKTIDAYRTTEPNDVVNEMHSIFGTEIGKLPTPLEVYYKRYFNNRQIVTDLAAKYQSEFTTRQKQLADDDTKLEQMKQQIDGLETDLKTKEQTISAQQAQLVALRSGGNISAYNAGVGPYNALIDRYNAEVQQLQALIDQYNILVNARNAVALEEDQLVKALSSQAAPIKQE